MITPDQFVRLPEKRLKTLPLYMKQLWISQIAYDRNVRQLFEEDLGPLTFGLYLKSHRNWKGYCLAKMAEVLGVSKKLLCEIESGRQLVSVRRAVSLARKCGVPENVAVEMVLMDQVRKAGLPFKVEVKVTLE